MQEVPEGEKRGRVHTSTVTVAIVDPGQRRHDPKLDLVKDSDFRVEWFSGSGAGGQNRNKTKNCARITHVPTGLVQSCQTRDRESSRRGAMDALRADLARERALQSGSNLSADRRAQQGSGMRGDKIRTYRAQDNMVTDHRSGKRAQLDQVLRGNFDLLG
jgi:peptide chain release factor 1